MAQCKGMNKPSLYPNSVPNAGKRCTSTIVNDKYKNGYCYRHQAQVPVVIIQLPDSDSEDEPFDMINQEKVLAELSLWMPNEKERVLSATQLVLDKCKQLTKEKEAMDQCFKQQSEKLLDLMKQSVEAKTLYVAECEWLNGENGQLKEQRDAENERHKIAKDEIDCLTKENDQLKKQLANQNSSETARALQSSQSTLLKEQLQDATEKISHMLEDYNAYQEIRRFEDISTRLMAIYMADNHYELYGMMRKNPTEAIPYLGKSPEIEYNCLRQKRNKHCHPDSTT